MDIKIPKYLQDTLDKQKRLEDEYEKTNDIWVGMKVKLVWEEVYADINQALIHDVITEAEARALRKKYLGI
ncbi:hypothetical protein HMPREF1633_12570 [Tissierellia bacterium S5-A11]|nr:hypothetical protein HMPREF1633_12570 [Tissierellia bacterium S5-A11]MDU6872069.1 hypothetical protein [Negativicoccus succinicivorans]